MRVRHNSRSTTKIQEQEQQKGQELSIDQALSSLDTDLLPPPLSPPQCMSRYIEVRAQLDLLERERRELEAEVTDWAKVMLRSGQLTGQELPTGTDHRLFMTIQKPKQDWLKNDPTVKQLREQIEQEQAEARVKNKARIEALEKHCAQLDKDIQRLSNTFRSESLINALQEYIEDTLPQLEERVGLRLHKAMKPEDLPPEQVIELYTEDVQFGIKYPVFRVPDEDVSLV